MTSESTTGRGATRLARAARRAAAIVVGVAAAIGVIEGVLAILAGVYGHESRASAPLDAPPGERRIVCLGDSNTFGIHLEPHESYPAQLHELLRRAPDGPWRVINLGFPGRSSAEIRYGLAEQLRTYRPEIAIVWAGVNDSWSRTFAHLWENPDREDPPGAASWAERLRLVRMLRVLFDRRPDSTESPAFLLSEPDAARLDFEQFPGGKPPDDGAPRPAAGRARGARVFEHVEDAEIHRRIQIDLRRIRAICDEGGARLLVLDYPFAGVGFVHTAVNPAIRGFAEASGTAYLSLWDALVPVIERVGRQRILLPDFHFRPAGNTEVARRVAMALIDAGWVAGGDWLDVPPVETRIAHVTVRELRRDGDTLRVELDGTPGARAAVVLDPLVLREGQASATPPDPRERAWLGYAVPEFGATRDLGTIDAEGRASGACPWPAAPPLAGPFGADSRLAGWRARVEVTAPGGDIAFSRVFDFTDTGEPVAARAAPAAEAHGTPPPR